MDFFLIYLSCFFFTTRFYFITYPRVKNEVNHKFLKLLCKLLVNLLKSSEIKRSIFFCKVTSGIA